VITSKNPMTFTKKLKLLTLPQTYLRRPKLYVHPVLFWTQLFTFSQAKIALDSDEYIRKLQEKYPLGNCEHYPHVRVLTRVVGGRTSYLELNLARVQIWANYLVRYFMVCFERI
jgi:hypothetical protein